MVVTAINTEYMVSITKVEGEGRAICGAEDELMPILAATSGGRSRVSRGRVGGAACLSNAEHRRSRVTPAGTLSGSGATYGNSGEK
jgi:hypothetical protein